MSKADEMFKELGYEKEFENEIEAYWNYKDKFFIRINKVCKSIDVKRQQEKGLLSEPRVDRISIDMQELQAINEKVRELQWI